MYLVPSPSATPSATSTPSPALPEWSLAIDGHWSTLEIILVLVAGFVIGSTLVEWVRWRRFERMQRNFMISGWGWW